MEAHAMTLCFAALLLLVDQSENAEPKSDGVSELRGNVKKRF